MHAISELPPDYHATAADLIVATTSKTWTTAKGRELVRYRKGSVYATVLPADVNIDELRALAQACIECAKEMEAGR